MSFTFIRLTLWELNSLVLLFVKISFFQKFLKFMSKCERTYRYWGYKPDHLRTQSTSAWSNRHFKHYYPL